MRLRLLPIAMSAMAMLGLVKLERILSAPPGEPPRAMVAQAQQPAPAATSAATPAPAPAAAAAPPAAPAAAAPDPRAEAERALLESLRTRRQDIERRGEEIAQRELLLAAAERRVQQRLEEMRAIQTRLETEARARDQREEAGIRQLVRVYEAMRPRDAAAILDELEMPVLLQVMDRMRDAKAAPVLAAMRPDRARAITTELSRLRSRPSE
ncbi:MAG: hypothetical protein NTW56_20995 [Alphaproteobacteria bacterium]|nr:hypothetical protein [Alphaproteobacteria bacterium]